MERVLAPKKILVVDSDPSMVHALRGALGFVADVEGCADFTGARESLLRDPPDFLVTNLRLGAYNGLHLVYLAISNGRATRSVCFSTFVDLPLIHEAQSIGAFFESPSKIPHTLASYLRAPLPPRDRRIPRATDRRREFRGGRRAGDLAPLAQA
jgi:DNA-binding NtrC family response regulator